MSSFPGCSFRRIRPLFSAALLPRLFFAAVCCATFSTLRAQTPPQRPNVIIIVADDLGYGDVSSNGCPDYTTPNIDAFGSNGVRFTNGYATYAVCGPSRAALLTGRYQNRWGYEYQAEGDNFNPRLGLPPSELTLAEILKPAGYVCGALGKWHLGAAPNLQPTARGFDEFYGFLGASANYYNDKMLRNNTPVTETTYLTEAFTREAVSFIDRHASQPFFLYLAYNAVHNPWDAPPANYLNRVANISDPDRRNYAAMVLALDDGIGKVMQELQTQGLMDNTLVFFLSDNGAPEKTFVRNLPLRGFKDNFLEGGFRVPFAMQWSSQLAAGAVYDQPVSSLDIVATAASAAGVTMPADRVYDGLDLLAYLANPQAMNERALFWRKSGLGKSGPPGSENTIFAVRKGPLKLVTEEATYGLPPALYNLGSDIGETTNLATTQPADAASLKRLYMDWSLDTITPQWRHQIAWQITPIVLAGDWNSFNINDTISPWKLTRITSPPAQGGTPDGFNWFLNTIHVASTGGDTKPGTHTFVIAGNQTYSNQWGGATVNIDATTTIPYYTTTTLAPKNTITFDDGYYYSFRLLERKGQIGKEMKLAVMKTSAPPVTVSRIAQMPATPTSTESTVVTIATSQPKSPQERVYLRWSSDFFLTSQLVQAAGSGNNYSATIPPRPPGTDVRYAIFTSSVDLPAGSTSGTIDALTLATTNVFQVITAGDNPTPSPTPTSSVDLKITVSDGRTATIAGQNDSYTIKATNVGTTSALGANITDGFPAIFTGVTFTATQSGGVTGFSASGIGNINDTVTMPTGSSITYIAKGKVSSSATGSISNTAAISAPVGVTDSAPANNSATDTDTIILQAAIRVTVTDGKTVAVAGAKNTYTIVVTNFGPSNVTGAVVSDNFPASFTGVGFTATQSGGASGFTASGSGSINDTVMMPTGSKVIYKAAGIISSSASGTLSNTATVTAPNGVKDPDLSNNTATDTDTL